MKWTKEEEEYLIKNYKKSNAELAKALNKSRGAVQQKMFRMRLLKPQLWTKEEDDFLIEKWDTLKIESICKELGRTRRAVEERGYNVLKLGSRNRWYTLLEVERMTGINKCTIRKRIVKEGLAHYRGKTKQKPYMLDEIQIKKFLKDHQYLWHHKNLTVNLFQNQQWYLDKVEAEVVSEANKAKHHKFYTEYEDNMLLEGVKNGLSYEEIAKRINRTEVSVRGRHRYKYNYLYKR